MAKVFTITEGLENLGALKTGGQGSVYKGKRTGEIITAIKLLPTPILHESDEDKNYKDFQNEVNKLKKVNEEDNPNVVTILGSGITETGCLPYIEMEFIEGPDLGELLNPPHDSVFTIKEAIKVATHLSNALAHCHQCDIKHGDIKSNNVKYNKRTGNYMLLDFGLAVMSDEDRRTSLRRAGAIEFMAPEQNQGQVLFETDVYSFGVIMFELLAGRVPFPLQDSGETARNAVMVSHMETPPPDVLELRSQNFPATWDEDKKNWEMQVPAWLVNMVYKCLEKKPGDRFPNGIELHDYIIKNSTVATSDSVAIDSEGRIRRLIEEKEELKQQLLVYQRAAEENESKLRELRGMLLQHEQGSIKTGTRTSAVPLASGTGAVSKKSFYTLMIVAAILAAITFYALVLNPNAQSAVASESLIKDSTDSVNNLSQHDNESGGGETTISNSAGAEKNTGTSALSGSQSSAAAAENNVENGSQRDTTTAVRVNQPAPAPKTTPVQTPKQADSTKHQDTSSTEGSAFYKVKGKAYFHNDPDVDTKRNAFIVHWNNATLRPLDQTEDFIYVVFTNHIGQTSKGWLAKKDLVRTR